MLGLLSLRIFEATSANIAEPSPPMIDADDQVCLSCITAGAAASGFIEAAWLAGRLVKRPRRAPGRAGPVDMGVYPGREMAEAPVTIGPGIRATSVSL